LIRHPGVPTPIYCQYLRTNGWGEYFALKGMKGLEVVKKAQWNLKLLSLRGEYLR
jgi:hypothetical protein